MAPIVMRAITQGTFDAFVKQGRETNAKVLSSLYAGIDADMMGGYSEPVHYIATAKNGKKVGIIPMLGPITKNGDMCSWGMRDYQNILSKLAKNESVVGVVIHFNNAPGGSHDGTPEISHNIHNYTKATLGFVDGYAASAHYWMASQTDHIMMNKLTDSEVGSIGSLIVYENIQNMIDKGEWPTTEIIRAPQSVNKARLNYIEPLTDEQRAELKLELKGVVKNFISDVKAGRGSRLSNDEEIFTGAMFGTDEAIRNGLADSKGSLQDAINKVAQLATSVPKSKSTSSPAKAQVINPMLKFTKLSALLGVAASLFTLGSEAEAKEVTISAEQSAALEAAEKALEDAEASAATLTAERDAQTTRIAELEKTVADQAGQITALEGEKTTLNATIADQKKQLEATPTGNKTTVIPDKGKESTASTDGSTENGNEAFLTSADRAAAQIRSSKKPQSTK